MKIAIIHDSFLHIGGAEKVLFSLLNIYPEADVYISLVNKKFLPLISNKIKGEVYYSFFSNLPFLSNYSTYLKPFIFLYWESLNLKKYDIVISSSHSFSSKSVSTTSKTVHISYIHTPPRYLYSEFNEVSILNNKIIKFLTKPLLNWLRKKDLNWSKKPNLLIANSINVKNRIKKYYKRNSLVIYPPIKTPKQKKIAKKKKEYFVCFSRLAKQKGIDLAIKACNILQLPLIIIGSGPEESHLKKIAGPTIKFRGFVSDQELPSILSSAKALINCAIEEDFGMVSVESMSYGTPVIGYNSGGIKEVIIENKTGLFFNHHNTKSLISAIKKFEKQQFLAKDCQLHAKKFSNIIFESKIKRIVNYYL